MTQQLFYEDVEVGQEIPRLLKHPDLNQLVRWAGAVRDFYEIHYDRDFAQSMGLKDVVVYGSLTYSFIGQLLTDWIGFQGRIKKFSVSYRGMNFVNQDIICRGKIIRKYEQDGNRLLELDVWAENSDGEITTPGSALVSLPSRTDS